MSTAASRFIMPALAVLRVSVSPIIFAAAAVAAPNPAAAADVPHGATTQTSEVDVTPDAGPPTSAQSSTHENPTTLGLSLQLAPLENFPRWGVNLDALYALNANWRLGLDGQLLLPHAYGDVERSGFNVNAQAQFTLLNGTHLRWYLTGGVGLGVLRDDYVSRSAFSDRTNVGFGVKVGTGLEARLFGNAPFLAFLEPQVRSYRTPHAVDDEWAELNFGLRWRLP